jgi:formyltetrahydrofolate hydrolase
VPCVVHLQLQYASHNGTLDFLRMYYYLVLHIGPKYQDVISVTHRDGVRGLITKGRQIERNVLVRALQAHLQDRVIVYKNKCVVFSD